MLLFIVLINDDIIMAFDEDNPERSLSTVKSVVLISSHHFTVILLADILTSIACEG